MRRRQHQENKESDANWTRVTKTLYERRNWERRRRGVGSPVCGSGQEILEGALGSRGKVSFRCVVWGCRMDLLNYFSMMQVTNGIPFQLLSPMSNCSLKERLCPWNTGLQVAFTRSRKLLSRISGLRFTTSSTQIKIILLDPNQGHIYHCSLSMV